MAHSTLFPHPERVRTFRSRYLLLAAVFGPEKWTLFREARWRWEALLQQTPNTGASGHARAFVPTRPSARAFGFWRFTRVIAVDMPNTHSANALEWYDYRRRGCRGTAPAPCGAAWMC